MLRVLSAHILLLTARHARYVCRAVTLIRIHLFVEFVLFQLSAKLRSSLLPELLLVSLYVHAFTRTLSIVLSFQRIDLTTQLG
jgi:hypothetical protein